MLMAPKQDEFTKLKALCYLIKGSSTIIQIGSGYGQKNVSRSLKYDSFHTDHFTLLALHVRGNYILLSWHRMNISSFVQTYQAMSKA